MAFHVLSNYLPNASPQVNIYGGGFVQFTIQGGFDTAVHAISLEGISFRIDRPLTAWLRWREIQICTSSDPG
jgi:hypothetical protein